MTDRIASRYDLGGGKICIITPTVGFNAVVTYAVAFEDHGKQLQPPKVQSGLLDQPVEIAAGDITITLTPHIRIKQ